MPGDDPAAGRNSVCDDGLMRVTEAAAFLAVSRATLYALMADGKLTSVRIGRSRRVPRRAVIRLAALALEPNGPSNGSG